MIRAKAPHAAIVSHTRPSNFRAASRSARAQEQNGCSAQCKFVQGPRVRGQTASTSFPRRRISASRQIGRCGGTGALAGWRTSTVLDESRVFMPGFEKRISVPRGYAINLVNIKLSFSLFSRTLANCRTDPWTGPGPPLFPANYC